MQSHTNSRSDGIWTQPVWVQSYMLSCHVKMQCDFLVWHLPWLWGSKRVDLVNKCTYTFLPPPPHPSPNLRIGFCYLLQFEASHCQFDYTGLGELRGREILWGLASEHSSLQICRFMSLGRKKKLWQCIPWSLSATRIWGGRWESQAGNTS